jgi:hypothetical protein
MFREEPFGRYFSHPFVPGEGRVALKGLVTAQCHQNVTNATD